MFFLNIVYRCLLVIIDKWITESLEYLKMILLIQINVLIFYLLHDMDKNKRWLKRRWKVRPINSRRISRDHFYTLFQELKEDKEMFFKMTRMDVDTFTYLTNCLSLYLFKPRSNILPEERLAITLRFLSTGDSINSIALDYRVGVSTCYNIITETCKIIFEKLSPIYLRIPSEEEWKNISYGFLNNWNLPNCCGAIDGKHIQIKCPPNSGSVYFNYKKNFSLILLAVSNHQYEFVLFDVGAVGGECDGGVFARSELGKAVRHRQLNLPSNDSTLPGTNIKVPYFFVVDAAFELTSTLMKPFPGLNVDERKRIFNYRLSRARRLIENAFGILVSRWQFLLKPIGFHPDAVINCVLAFITLHNFLMSSTNVRRNLYCPSEFLDQEDNFGLVRKGLWRKECNIVNPPQDIDDIPFNDNVLSGKNIREILADYFLTPEGEVPWQYDYVRRGSYNDFS